MAKYKYIHANPTAFTLNGGEDYHLQPGGEYELPSDNEFIQSLVDQDFLEELPEPKPSKTNRDTK